MLSLPLELALIGITSTEYETCKKKERKMVKELVQVFPLVWLQLSREGKAGLMIIRAYILAVLLSYFISTITPSFDLIISQ